MGVLHALAMAVWVGGVILLARVVLSGPGDEDLVHAVRGFSRVSTPAIVVTIVTGLVQMFRLDGGELFQSGHGRVVVLKTVVVAVMIFVAFSARQFVSQRLQPRPADERAPGRPAPSGLRRRGGDRRRRARDERWLLAFVPPNVDDAPTIDYDVTQTHTDEAGIARRRDSPHRRSDRTGRARGRGARAGGRPRRAGRGVHGTPERSERRLDPPAGPADRGGLRGARRGDRAADQRARRLDHPGRGEHGERRRQQHAADLSRCSTSTAPRRPRRSPCRRRASSRSRPSRHPTECPHPTS